MTKTQFIVLDALTKNNTLGIILCNVMAVECVIVDLFKPLKEKVSVKSTQDAFKAQSKIVANISSQKLYNYSFSM